MAEQFRPKLAVVPDADRPDEEFGACPVDGEMVLAMAAYVREHELTSHEQRALRRLLSWVLEDFDNDRKQSLLRYRL